MNPSRPTIDDVARVAGTSTGTVSRVLNGRPGVAPATRQRVLGAIAALDFTPDSTARALSRAATQAPVIALAFPAGGDALPYYSLLRRALLAAVEQAGVRGVEVDERDAATVRADAVVFVRDEVPEPLLRTLERRARSVVVVGRHEHASWVCIDDEGGMTNVTRALLDLGHEAVLHVGSAEAGSMPEARLRGYRRGMTERGLERDLIQTKGGGFALGAYRAVTRAWTMGRRFTALACWCDEAALGARLALLDLGLRVPEDVSVAGFDGLPRLGVTLTTVRQDFPTIARAALGMVHEDLHERRRREAVLDTALVPGGTSSRCH